jgi:glycosyltransferase involved in cell wall biosynthesis
MRVLAITKIFPNAAEPLSAPFNRQQFAALRAHCDVEVMATIPWFPGAGLLARWSSAGRLVTVPARECIAGLDVRHPRTLFLPRIGHVAWGPLYAASIAPAMVRYRRRIDVVLGSWAYPDGFAAVIAARMLGVPAVVKLHGSDINVITKLPGARRLAAWALPHAARVVAVSRPLADEVIALGVARERVAIVMNGVDRELFRPRDRAAARAELGLPAGPLVLYVGNLKPEKGVLDLLAAWQLVSRRSPAARLALAGGGPLRGQLDARAADLPSIHVVGAQPLDRIPVWMAAADVLCLPSHVEGTPNVVLEALASGRRVVATTVGGIPDLVPSRELGVLVSPRAPAALADALVHASREPYDQDAVAQLGARGGWAASAAQLHAVLEQARGYGACSDPRRDERADP